MLKPVLKWEEFRNEELNNRINMVFDYQMFGDSLSREKHFSFLEYPFILNTANKVEKLLLDNRASHNSERQRTFVHTLLTGVRDTPFLHLHINREDIVSDTLSQVHIPPLFLVHTYTCTVHAVHVLYMYILYSGFFLLNVVYTIFFFSLVGSHLRDEPC